MRAILMLHGVDTSGSVLSIRPEELRSLLRSIHASGHEIVPLLTLLQHPEISDRVALTFDDGFTSVAETAAPILEQAGCVAALFLTTGRIARDNRWPSQPASTPVFPMMGWGEIETLHARGWQIAAHSHSHPDLRELGDSELDRELVEPKRVIASRLGAMPDSFAYPYGAVDARVCDATRRHYRYALTTRMAPLDHGSRDPHRLPRLDVFYLRHPRVHSRFARADFRTYLELRHLLRRATGHPGESG